MPRPRCVTTARRSLLPLLNRLDDGCLRPTLRGLHRDELARPGVAPDLGALRHLPHLPSGWSARRDGELLVERQALDEVRQSLRVLAGEVLRQRQARVHARSQREGVVDHPRHDGLGGVVG